MIKKYKKQNRTKAGDEPERISGLFSAVCPAKLDHTCRCKSGHGNRQ